MKTALLFFALLLTGIVSAQTTPKTRYYRREVLIPMRDGINLNTVIFTPKPSGKPLPTLFNRTSFQTGMNQWKTYTQWPPADEATEVDFLKATHTIFRSAGYPSHLELSVMPR